MREQFNSSPPSFSTHTPEALSEGIKTESCPPTVDFQGSVSLGIFVKEL